MVGAAAIEGRELQKVNFQDEAGSGKVSVVINDEGDLVRGFIFGIVFSIIVAAGAAYGLIASGMIPANADAKPGSVEVWAAETSLRATLASQAPKEANPVALTDANLLEGVRLYGQHCVVCHGNSKGDDSATPIAKGEYPAPPQLAADGVEDDPEGWTFWKLQHGIRWSGMPSWKDTLNDNQMWTLALLLKHMDKLPPAVDAEWKALASPGQTAAPAPTQTPAPAK